MQVTVYIFFVSFFWNIARSGPKKHKITSLEELTVKNANNNIFLSKKWLFNSRCKRVDPWINHDLSSQHYFFFQINFDYLCGSVNIIFGVSVD